jgi:hypothetical protein
VGKYGQAILTIVGTVVGAYFGYPALGAALGSLAGGYLFPAQLPTVSGPRLADLTSTSATVGTPITRGWGTFPAAGCIIWQSDVREVIEKEEVGGKGSSSQTVETPTYYQDFAVGLNDGEIQGIRRMWGNGKIVVDRKLRNPLNAGDTFYGRAIQQLLRSQMEFDQMEIYLGTEDQEPSPTIEAALGVGNISAFRGLAYVVFVNWKCKPEDGNRIPGQWKFELYTNGLEEEAVLDVYANERLFPWTINAIDPRTLGNLHSYGTGGGEDDQPYSTVAQAIAAAGTVGGYSMQEGELRGWWPSDGNGNEIMPYDEDVTSTERRVVKMWYARWSNPAQTRINVDGDEDKCATWPSCEEPWWAHTTGDFFDMHATYQVSDNDLCLNVFGFAPGSQHGICFGGRRIWQLQDGAIWVLRSPAPPADPCYAEIPGTDAYCLDIRGSIVPTSDWVYDTSTTYRALRSYDHSGTTITAYPLDPIRPVGHLQYNLQSFWEASYADAVARGKMAAGLTYGVHYPTTKGYGYKRPATGTSVLTFKVLLWEIIRDISIEAGMTEDQLDLTDIDDIEITGYVRTRVMTARAAIDPLRSFGFFDAYESNGKLKFVKRGAAIVATIPDDDLGVHTVGEQAPSRITTRKLMDFDLPRQVRVHYISESRDYEAGQQDSPVRIETDAVNDMDIELPIVLSDEEAAQIASVLWADYWASRHLHEIVLDAKYHYLEPTDAIAVPVDGNVERMRIVNTTDTIPNIRKFELQRDDDGAFVSYAVAESPPLTPPPLAIISPAEVVLLDLPPLRDEDNDAGVYAAARSLAIDAIFQGAAIMRSADGGSNYTTISSVDSQTPMGLLVGDAPIGPTSIWDEGNSIKVDLLSGALESRTALAVLSGANAAAIGGHGFWEIVQFRDVEQISETIFRLSGLLRGRRGTEHNVGLAVDGDRFVMLSTGTLTRVPLDLSLVNKPMLYKAVSAGLPIESATVQEFTGEGEALKPFSPGWISATRDTAGTITITWIRRGRIGQTLAPGTDVPLSEEVEDYEVEILDGDEARRTISTLNPTAIYTGEQQVVDFGSVQAAITVRVYQISAAVGRGHYSEEVL